MICLFAVVGVTIYLIGHFVNVAWAPPLIGEVARSGTIAPAIASQYAVLANIYNAAMLGGTLFTGVALLIFGIYILRTRSHPRALGALALAAGVCDVVTFMPLALPLTGSALIWLGAVMLFARDENVDRLDDHAHLVAGRDAEILE